MFYANRTSLMPGYIVPMSWPIQTLPYGAPGNVQWKWPGTPHDEWSRTGVAPAVAEAQALACALADFVGWYGTDWGHKLGAYLGAAHFPLVDFWAAWESRFDPTASIAPRTGKPILRTLETARSWETRKNANETRAARQLVFPATALARATKRALDGKTSPPPRKGRARPNPYVKRGYLAAARADARRLPPPALQVWTAFFPSEARSLPPEDRLMFKVQKLLQQYMYERGYTLQMAQLEVIPVPNPGGYVEWSWRNWGTPYKFFSAPFPSMERAAYDAWCCIEEDWENYTEGRWKKGLSVQAYIRKALEQRAWPPLSGAPYKTFPKHPITADKPTFY